MRLAEIHHQLQTFNQMIAPYFHIDAALPHHLPPMHTGHKFETVINGVTMDVYYVSKWDGLECDEVLLYNSIKAQIDDANLFPLLGAETQHQIERLVEQDFNRTQGWEDWQ